MPPHPLAVVTGSSLGFGAAVVDALTAAGWPVIGVSRSARGDGGSFEQVLGDVTAAATVELVARQVGDRPVALLVNNAGQRGGGRTLADVRDEDLAQSYATHVVAPLTLTRALVPQLAEARGLVVNVSSRLASLGCQAADHYDQARLRTSYGYRITKAAQNMLTIALAQELAAMDVAVWALHPGRLTTRLGSIEADTSPHEAATRLVELIAARDPQDLRPRFRSLDDREAGGGDIPW